MAQVPYEGGVPTVAPSAAPPDDYEHIQANPDAFGATIGRGLEKAGAGLEQTSNNAFGAAKFWGEIQTDGAINNTLTDVNKKIATFRSLRGQAALDAQENTKKEIDEAFKQGREGLTSPEQQHQYDQSTRAYQQRYISGLLTSHADQEGKVYARQVNKSSHDLAVNTAATVANDPAAVDMAIHDGRSAVIRDLQAEGNEKDPQIVKDAIFRSDQKIYATVAQAKSVHDPKGALDYVELHRKELGDQYDNVANALRTRAEAQEGNSAGAKAVAEVAASRFTPAVNGAIARAAAVYGVDENTLRRFAVIESSGNPSARTGSYQGLFQLSADEFQRHGGGNILDANDNAAAAAAKLKAESGAFLAKYGRSPTAADLYMIHQQGAGGYAAHLANPDAPAWQNMLSTGEGQQKGEAWAKRAIWGNIPDNIKQRFGSVENVTSRDFTTMWAGIVNNGASNFIKKDAYQRVLDDPSLSVGAREHALTYINRSVQAQQIAENETIKAKKEANDNAADGYVSRMIKGDMKGMTDQIADDPNLQWQTRQRLAEIAEKQSGADVEHASAQYGPGFWGAWKAITAPADDPARISDPSDLLHRAGPDGDLTLAGVQKLSGVLKDIQKSPNDASVNHTKVGLMNYAKGKLSFEADTGPIKIRDPKGEAIFNARFIPKFEAAYDNWIKAGKNPWEFLTQDNVDKLMTGMRPKSEMEMERLRATGEATPEAQQPVPPAPAGVNEAGWKSVIQAVPKSQSGKPWPYANWMAAVNELRSDPSPEKMAAFNQVFGPAGYDAKDILGKLAAAAADRPGYIPRPGAF